MWKCSKCETLNDAEYCSVCGAHKSLSTVSGPPANAYSAPTTGYSSNSVPPTIFAKSGKEGILRIASIVALIIHFLFLFLPTVAVEVSFFGSYGESYSAAGYMLSSLATSIDSSSYSYYVQDSGATASIIFVLFLISISNIFLLACMFFFINIKKITKTKMLMSVAANILAFLSVPIVIMYINNENTGLGSGLVGINMTFLGWLYLILTICGTVILVMYYFEIAKSTGTVGAVGSTNKPMSTGFNLACPSCGSPQKKGAPFCSNCGNPFLPANTATAPGVYAIPTYPSAGPAPVTIERSVNPSGEIKSTFRPKDSTAEEESSAAAVAELKNTFKKADDLD